MLLGHQLISETHTPLDRVPSSMNELNLVNFSSQQDLLTDLNRHWSDGRGFAVATLNLDHIVKMRRSDAFRAAYQKQTHVVADGNPVVWLSRLAGRSVDLVPGSELIAPLSALAAEQAVPVALLGATQDTLDLAAERLEHAHPGLQVVARIAPPLGYDPDGPTAVSDLKQVAASGARLCFLALGAPKQERLAVLGRTHAPECGFVSIGAGLDFVAGSQTRAPRWVRKLALEWVWRLLSNPTRLAARYGRCILIMPGLTMAALRGRFQG